MRILFKDKDSRRLCLVEAYHIGFDEEEGLKVILYEQDEDFWVCPISITEEYDIETKIKEGLISGTIDLSQYSFEFGEDYEENKEVEDYS